MVNGEKVILDKELEEVVSQTFKRIKVIGCGGAGSNTISRLYEMGVEGVELIAMNTDVRHLLNIQAHKRVLLGKQLTKGLGAGKDPKVGEEATKESEQEVKKIVEGSDIVFVTCGLGGGTGTGAAPIVADIAKKMGALVIGICTWPFSVEGANIWDNAQYGLERLENSVDMLVVIPNDKILQLFPNLPLKQAFKAVDNVLAGALKEISELLTKPGYINADFADFRSVVAGAGYGLFGIGESNSENKAVEAAQRALTNPLVDIDIAGAKAALVRITASEDVTPEDINKILDTVKSVLDPKAKLIYGVMFEEGKKSYVRVSLIVTRLKSIPTFIRSVKGITEIGEEKKKEIESELGIEII
ncbi:MAG: cell division protein FtsZ [Candidatus Nanoclepta minutus]|uniref:Cell division protein FtsZ n=1 Tax=Candidatus Nanoclepta minutus TaxID=1940235 RepID=A0A397WNZ6_9ARCH|nr:MAG: cell division protein FtsZ [Candidatus Nanoclepta minutus]